MEVTRLLLPQGRIRGPEYVCGDISGNPGESLSVRISGDNAGIWSDFATGQSGDLLDLWQATRGIDLKAALKQAHDYLGIQMPNFEAPRKEWIRPKRPECTVPKSIGLAYLKSRGITDEAIAAYHIGESGRDLVFPFLRDGELIMAKRREAVDGAKPKPTEANCEKCLFGWQALLPGARAALICEGEIDAMSAYVLGIPALSVPYGAGGGNKQDWIENEFDHLERFDEIYVCMDRDKPGDEAVTEIVRRLGAHRCRIVKIPAPHKDINNLLKEAWTADQFAHLLHGAQSLDPGELRQASDFEDAVIDEFYPRAEQFSGFVTPWKKLDGQLQWRESEVILLAGFNGCGKTELAGSIVLAALQQNVRTCVASLEFKPRKWLKRLTRQASGVDIPTKEYARAIMRWYQDRLWVFDDEGKPDPKRMLEVMDYAVRRYQIKFFVIDNLAKCGFDEDDYNKQKSFIDDLTRLAKQHGAIVMLVAHMRKGQNEERAGGKMDIKGSGAITDMVDTVLVFWRNKPKELKLEANPGDPEQLNLPDAFLYCEKQRNGEHEPKAGLWFHRQSHQFLEYSHSHPPRYVQFSVVGANAQ